MNQLRFQCRHRYASGFTLDAKFDVGDGVTGLFGPSGSGKSTILSILAGILRPQSGKVLLGDRILLDTAAGTCLPPDRRRIGLVFQDHLLFPHMTIEANLRFGLRRRPTHPINFDQLVDLLELRPLLDRYPHTLSGGQRQRAALGRAILSGPELLLLDEPLAALDVPLKERILVYLERAIAQWRIPTLFVSHDQADVRRLADQVIIIEDGKVIQLGPTASALDSAVISTMRSHPGPINLLRFDELRSQDGHWSGRLHEQWLHLPAEAVGRSVPLFAQVLPRDVMLASQILTGVSVRNQLQGEVRQIVEVDGRAYVAIDVGQFLWAKVTPDAVRELALSPGKPVICLIKASAIQLLV